MTLIIYLGKTILIAGLLFGYYCVFLQNKQFHQYNRIYLLSISLISFLLPAFHSFISGKKGNGLGELL